MTDAEAGPFLRVWLRGGEWVDMDVGASQRIRRLLHGPRWRWWWRPFFSGTMAGDGEPVTFALHDVVALVAVTEDVLIRQRDRLAIDRMLDGNEP